ncbi:hypothetical protein JYU34_017428 [Plutella xylostella]|uniref:Uncharacterized protein n=1 Tax=Plutella xylostella TaxID=51655 RepID=A0ABQ7Q153_PLUXY|nr:hypothetical protein JYU34_017428 [Plutella xylostella]
MSSEETDESLQDKVKFNVNDSFKNNELNCTLQSHEDVKCLIQEPQCATYWNEIPCCSNVNISVKEDGLDLPTGVEKRNQVSDFIVIDMTCNISEFEVERKVLGSNVACDNSSISSLEQPLVPVMNNELVQSENQKLVSLSLSILLAALLQAVRCFAQFLENIVIPQRQL